MGTCLCYSPFLSFCKLPHGFLCFAIIFFVALLSVVEVSVLFCNKLVFHQIYMVGLAFTKISERFIVLLFCK